MPDSDFEAFVRDELRRVADAQPVATWTSVSPSRRPPRRRFTPRPREVFAVAMAVAIVAGGVVIASNRRGPELQTQSSSTAQVGSAATTVATSSPTSTPPTTASPTTEVPTTEPTTTSTTELSTSTTTAWTSTTVSETSPYTVADGDTLYSIAVAHGITIADLVALNGWPDGENHLLLGGSEVLVPSG